MYTFTTYLIRCAAVALPLVFAAGCKKSTTPQVFLASGDIQPVLEDFREALGPLNTEPGAPAEGRREVNWDGVPDSLLDKTLPSDFFNPTGPGAPVARQRGLAYDPDERFAVSNDGFAAVNQTAAETFTAFSGDKTFANVANALWFVSFREAGNTEPASVRGFGMVLVGVDVPESTTIEFFNGDESLEKISVPPRNHSSNFSFAGILFDEPVITRVQVSHRGKLADGQPDITQGGDDDLIVLDDFIYGEPVKATLQAGMASLMH